MTEQLKQQSIAFIRSLADKCSSCLRRMPDNCANCVCYTASILMREIKSQENSPLMISYSYWSRSKLIVDILAKARRPLMSSEIKLNGICSRQLKMWTLNRMMSKNVIGRKPAARSTNGRVVFKYFLKSK